MEILIKRGYTEFVRIDSGGQANVYKTVKNGRLFAIKVVPIEEKADGNLEDDLKRELIISRSLRHTNCIRIEEIFRTRSRMYIVMDFMPNGTVGSVVRKQGPLCEWNIKVWFPGMLKAIAYLHRHRVAHRDFKLDNVLLDAYFNPIISDYGFSRLVEVDSKGVVVKSETYCGTLSYNPPEILRKIPYDPFKADIWTLGIGLFIMTNQVYPFDRKEGAKRMYQRQQERNYRLQADIQARSSAELKALIDLLLEPVAEKRPSITEVLTHPWVPIVHQEAARLQEKSSKSGGGRVKSKQQTEMNDNTANNTTNRSR